MKRKLLPLLLLLNLSLFSQAPATFYVSGFAGTGACDGSFRVSGCAPYTIAVAGPNFVGGSFSLNNMCYGTWNIALTNTTTGDSYGFNLIYGSSGVTVVNPSPATTNILSAFATVVSSTLISPNCNGLIALDIQGGTPPYTIGWTDASNQIIAGATNDTLSGVCSGNYSFNVTDNGPCLGSGTPFATLRVPQLSCTISTVNASCYGSCDGGAQLQIVASGQSILTNSIVSAGNTGTTTLTNQCAGSVSGFVSDVTGAYTGCSGVIAQPTVLQYQQDSVSYEGDLYFTIFGGTPPYTSVIDSLDTLVFYAGQIHYDSLVVGPHVLDLIDSAGCHFNQSVMIPSNVCSAQIIMGNTDCYQLNNNSVTVIVSGQPPFQYTWSNGDISQIADSIPFGDTITVIVTDSYGCVATDLRVFPNFNFPLQCYTQVISNASCSGWPVCCDGSVVLNFQDSLLLCSIDNYYVSGGYMYNCIGAFDHTYYTSTITNLANATYTVIPMSSCGCPYGATTFNVPGSPVSLMEKPVQTNEVKIVPNPSNGEFVVTSNLIPDKVKLYTIEGKEIQSVLLPDFSGSATLYLKDLPNGVYVLKLTKKNKVLGHERLIIIN